MAGGSSVSLAVVDADQKKKATKKRTTSARAKSPVRKTTIKKPKVATKAAVAKNAVVKKPTAKKVTKNKTTKATTTKKTNPKKKTVAKEKTTVKKKATSKKPTVTTKAKPTLKKSDAPALKRDVVLNSNKSTAGLRRDSLGHLLVEKKLTETGFRGDISTDRLILDAYSTDESIFAIRPQMVIKPKSQKDVEIAVQVIAKETPKFPALSLTPRAAGTGLSGGSLTDSIVIDVSAYMTRIDAPVTKKGETTITCEPGAMWRDVETKLLPQDCYLPSAPASKDICSIGGSVANNAAGADSLRYGHTADWVASLNVTFYDGNTYTVQPLNYKQFKTLIKEKHAYAKIAKQVFEIIEKNEKTILAAEPKTKKNTAGFPLWDVLSDSVAQFKKGNGTFDMTRLISGSQGTLGVITAVTMRTLPITDDTTLIVLPIFDLECAGRAILQALKYDPVNIEVFDDLSFDLALKNPDFFRERMKNSLSYYKVMLTLYTTYHVRYRRTIPQFTLLITLDDEVIRKRTRQEILTELQSQGCNVVRFVKSPEEREMWWQVRRASYSLSKMQDGTKRPAAFLEDMTVPPQNLFGFFKEIKELFAKYNINAAVHGHGGNGHFHFYPLLDFEKKETPDLIERMSEEFFNCAINYGGSLCGEHNDGIIRTPHLKKMFNKKTLELFAKLENTFDPDDIFNPGKKVNPRFDIKDSLRKTN